MLKASDRQGDINFILLIPLALTPFLTRVLGAEGIGQYSYTRSMVTYFVLFGTIGSNMYAQREIAYVSGERRESNLVICQEENEKVFQRKG